MRLRSNNRQYGVSLTGLIFVLAILAMIGVLGLRVVPTISEFLSVKNAIVKAKDAGLTPAEVKASFDKQAQTSYIESISSKDLEIFKSEYGDGLDISFEYQKKISLFGPASLVIDYEGSTAPKTVAKKKQIE